MQVNDNKALLAKINFPCKVHSDLASWLVGLILRVSVRI